MTHAFVVVNPPAGGHRTSWVWCSLRDQLRRLGLDFEFSETAGRGAATDLARQAVHDGWRLVVAVGESVPTHGAQNIPKHCEKQGLLLSRMWRIDDDRGVVRQRFPRKRPATPEMDMRFWLEKAEAEMRDLG